MQQSAAAAVAASALDEFRGRTDGWTTETGTEAETGARVEAEVEAAAEAEAAIETEVGMIELDRIGSSIDVITRIRLEGSDNIEQTGNAS